MYYQSHQQLQGEAHRILRDDEFTGDIGDFVLPALVNVLAIPMTVFTSAENMLVLILHEGPGHYDAVI